MQLVALINTHFPTLLLFPLILSQCFSSHYPPLFSAVGVLSLHHYFNLLSDTLIFDIIFPK